MAKETCVRLADNGRDAFIDRQCLELESKDTYILAHPDVFRISVYEDSL